MINSVKIAAFAIMGGFFLSTQSSFSQSSDLPEVNQEVIKYVDDHMNQKIDRGECWDLLKQALDPSHNGSIWSHEKKQENASESI